MKTKNTLFIVLITIFFSCQSFAQVKTNFPTLVGHTLEGTAITLPENPAKKFTIVGICFKRTAEDALKTWINPMYNTFVAKANSSDYFDVANYYDVNYFFIPLISGFKKAANEFKANTQEDLWKNVIDCDTDIKLLKEQLKPSDENAPYFFVINLQGKIVEVVSGKFTEDKMDKLQEAID